MRDTLCLSGIFRGICCSVVLVTIGMAASGCALFGWLANATPPPDIKPAYPGLKGETVAIWVYADDLERLDFPHIEDDLAGAIQSHLKESEAEDLATTRYQDVQKLSDYQRVHPELRGQPATQFAANLGVTRLIYVELHSFSTRQNVSVDLFRGKAVADVRVIEVIPNLPASAKVAFKEANVSARFPEQTGEGENIGELESPDVNAQSVYVGTIQAIGLEIAERFYLHPAPEDMDK